MDLNLNDKVVLVSGSSCGIGKAIAKGFATEGAKVVITGLKDADFDRTAEEFLKDFPGKTMQYSGDLTDSVEIHKCLETVTGKWKTIDVFIGNIGNGRSKPVLAADRKEWQKMLDINLLCAVEAARQIVPIMQKNKKSSIVFTASIAGIENIGAPAPYAAAKAALLSYVKSLSSDLAEYNIRVNAVAPGNIKFPGGRWEEILAEKPAVMKDLIEKEVSMKRFGNPEEIADAVLFLASERASFITGTCLVVDGGQTRRI
ncbi:MAG: SDR family oxidoreductase [Candidatus Margulisiibacteriota bacterium]